MTIALDRPVAGHETARKAMIDSQLRTSGVNAEFVLRRMAAVARERFVPESARGFAYIDRAISLGGGRYLVEGLKFHMPGSWVVAFRIKAGTVTDSVRFELAL